MYPVLRIFIGYDEREAVAFHVLSHSLLRHTTMPIAIIPLKRSALCSLYQRERGPLESTDFSMTRFLVPALCQYEGHAVFMDCDMLARADVAQLWGYIVAYLSGPVAKSVLVCQHDYTPSQSPKFLGQPQTVYPRKNWSSVMVFNNEMCRALTPEYVNNATGLDLHRFAWLRDDQIGALPLEWNWLLGEYDPDPDAKVLHWTRAGPWFPEYRDAPMADEWRAEYLKCSSLDPSHA